MARTDRDDLLLGEWACLGVLYGAPSHGFAVAARLRPDADVGRIWSLSRALTYRSLDQLVQRGLVEAIGEEPGIAGGNRTVLAITDSGRAALLRWVTTPVEHLRDLRSAFLLKIVLAGEHGIDITDMLRAQRRRIGAISATLDGNGPVPAAAAPDDTTNRDIVTLWRHEAATAALRFVDRLLDPPPPER